MDTNVIYKGLNVDATLGALKILLRSHHPVSDLTLCPKLAPYCLILQANCSAPQWQLLSKAAVRPELVPQTENDPFRPLPANLLLLLRYLEILSLLDICYVFIMVFMAV